MIAFNRILYCLTVLMALAFNSVAAIACAQESLRTAYPQAFVTPRIGDFAVEGAFSQLELTEEQLKQSRVIAGQFQNWSMASGETVNELSIRLFNEFSAVLFEHQRAKLEQMMVLKFFEREAMRQLQELTDGEGHRVLKSTEAILLLPEIAKRLEMSDQQQAAVLKEVESFGAANESFDSEYDQATKRLLQQWQDELFGRLLEFQKRDFLNAVGKPFEFPKELGRVQSRANAFGPMFLSGKKVESSASITPPKEIDLIFETPFYLDAHMHPAGMFALLLTEEVERELKITESQRKLLMSQRDLWREANPLPAKLEIDFVFGSSLTPKTQRDKEASSNEELGEMEKAALNILKPRQRDRLRQIWNQLLLSMGWQPVSLTFPDWRGYLNLSEEQRLEFNNTNNKFLRSIEELAIDLRQKRRDSLGNYRSRISALLSPSQADQLKRLLGVSFKQEK